MRLVSKTLVVLAICAAGALAQSRPSAEEQRFKAKYGRYTPAEEARRAEEKANTAYRDATPPRGAEASRDNWSEDRHRAKFGRPTPTEEKKIDAEKANTAYREVTGPVEDRWHDNYLRSKHGRSAPAKK
jgi:hypothetical protein